MVLSPVTLYALEPSALAIVTPIPKLQNTILSPAGDQAGSASANEAPRAAGPYVCTFVRRRTFEPSEFMR